MTNRVIPLRFRRITLASLALVVALLVAPVLSAQAQWVSYLQAPIQVASGGVLGTATFTRGATGGVSIQVTLNGFDPVAGSHRVAIAVGGACYPLSFWCAGSEPYVLPDMQFFPNGSASYSTVTGAFTLEWLASTPGAALIIHADTNPGSQVIGRGAIGGGAPPWTPPAPPAWTPPAPPAWTPPAPPAWTPPAPPVHVVGRYRVTASDGLRLRYGPGTWYGVRRVLGLGATVTATGIEQWGGGILWAKVGWGGGYYWAAKAWLQAY